jgi:hypothetical protein
MLLINSFPPCCARLTLEPPFWLAAQYSRSFMDFIRGLANLSREHLALACPIWKITRGSLHGLIKDSLEWSMVASQPAAGIARALIRGNNDFHLKQSPSSRLQMADSRHPACKKMTRTTRGLYCTANTGLLVSQCAAHSSTPRPTAEMMMQTRVTIKW